MDGIVRTALKALLGMHPRQGEEALVARLQSQSSSYEEKTGTAVSILLTDGRISRVSRFKRNFLDQASALLAYSCTYARFTC
jgi:hypothetical protein